jgi:abortive infection bacteriophage resistance protein
MPDIKLIFDKQLRTSAAEMISAYQREFEILMAMELGRESEMVKYPIPDWSTDDE